MKIRLCHTIHSHRTRHDPLVPGVCGFSACTRCLADSAHTASGRASATLQQGSQQQGGQAELGWDGCRLGVEPVTAPKSGAAAARRGEPGAAAERVGEDEEKAYQAADPQGDPLGNGALPVTLELHDWSQQPLCITMRDGESGVEALARQQVLAWARAEALGGEENDEEEEGDAGEVRSSGLQAHFVEDVTIPDGHVVAPGEVFVKVPRAVGVLVEKNSHH